MQPTFHMLFKKPVVKNWSVNTLISFVAILAVLYWQYCMNGERHASITNKKRSIVEQLLELIFCTKMGTFCDIGIFNFIS